MLASLRFVMKNPVYPPISASCLFHFTNSLENLLGILRDDFRPRFCVETLDSVFSSRIVARRAEWAIPMVCFCDLPLSQIGFHLSIYGDYGIGMSKSWARTNGISPILYVYEDSPLSVMLQEIGDLGTNYHLNEDIEGVLGYKLMRLLSFVKPYEGTLWRPTGDITNLRFYDEREWRFVPDSPANGQIGILATDCRDETKRGIENARIGETVRISFNPSDVKYLIIRREEEIVPLIKDLEQIKGDKYSLDDVRLLASRVVSSEQIRADF